MRYERLKGMSCYLAGAIDLSPDYGFSWRQETKLMLSAYGVKVYDPTDKHVGMPGELAEDIKQRKAIKAAGEYDKLTAIMKEIRQKDLRMCDLSDFAISYIDLDVFSCGTFEEMFLLNRSKKVIITVCKQKKANLPDWWFGSHPHELMFDTFEQAYDYLKHVHDDETVETYGRWVFL